MIPVCSFLAFDFKAPDRTRIAASPEGPALHEPCKEVLDKLHGSARPHPAVVPDSAPSNTATMTAAPFLEELPQRIGKVGTSMRAIFKWALTTTGVDNEANTCPALLSLASRMPSDSHRLTEIEARPISRAFPPATPVSFFTPTTPQVERHSLN